MIHRLLMVLALVLPLAQANAQDRDGSDTPSNWRVVHYKEFGIFKSMCDERDEDGTLVQRCYIRYVDVFSEDPKFAAVFMFVFQKDRKTAFQYAFEKGTVYADDGLRIERNHAVTWRATDGCRRGPNCLMTNTAEVDKVINAFNGGGTLVQDFVDRHGVKQLLEWNLAGFDQAYDDYLAESGKRRILD